jgi:hypothetical protein
MHCHCVAGHGMPFPENVLGKPFPCMKTAIPWAARSIALRPFANLL